MGVLRWRRLLDFLLEPQMKKTVDGNWILAVAIALRMGAYQLRYLEKVPARAAVNESVELVKHARKSSAASLVNAVLRKMASEAKIPAREIPAARPGLQPSASRFCILIRRGWSSDGSRVLARRKQSRCWRRIIAAASTQLRRARHFSTSGMRSSATSENMACASNRACCSNPHLP